MRACLLLSLVLAGPACAQGTSVLFIGNSYTFVNDLPNTFRQLALSLGDTVVTGMAAVGGYQLGNHLNDPASLAALASRPWDFVALQEQSQLGALPFEDTGMEPASAALTQLIEANDECTYPVFYMTWGRQDGDASMCPTFPEMCTYASMQQALRNNYVAVAEEYDGYVAPVGVAWKQVREDQPLIGLYADDGSHPSMAGTYLAACVFYATLFRQPCVGASFTAGLGSDIATSLQTIASAVVLDSVETWNMDVPNGTDATISGSSSDAPNTITYYHPGAGQHWWICSDGGSSNEQNPTFVLPGPGVYTFTHIYIDPCGNMDTVTWTAEVYATGITEGTSPEGCHVWSPGPAELEVTGGHGTDLLTVFDVQGRVLLAQQLSADRTRIPCPTGMRIWTIRDGQGNTTTGKLFVP